MRRGPEPLVESVVRATRPMSRTTYYSAMRVPPLPKGKKPAGLPIDYCVLLLLAESDGEQKVLFQSGIQGGDDGALSGQVASLPCTMKTAECFY